MGRDSGGSPNTWTNTCRTSSDYKCWTSKVTTKNDEKNWKTFGKEKTCISKLRRIKIRLRRRLIIFFFNERAYECSPIASDIPVIIYQEATSYL